MTSTCRSRPAWIALLAALLLTLIVDLSSKYAAFAYIADHPVTLDRSRIMEIQRQDPRAIGAVLPPHEPIVVVPHLLEFKLVLNPGAVFGIGAGRRVFFAVFTVVAIAFGLYVFARWTLPRDRAAHAAIGLIIGGGLGNLYDRIIYACVRDFLHPLPGVHWPFGLRIMGSREVWPYVSNVADALLLVGIAVLFWHLWRKDTHRGQAVENPPEPRPR